jgi:PAS domain-containing protein
VCEDETFHPEVCLVGLEPVSNFILLEQYAKDRTAATWTQALTAALEGLAVEVIQGTSDEGKGLVSHVQSALGAHHSPDLFHVQHEVVKATSLPLARQVKQAEAAVAQARGQWQAAREAQAAFERQPQPARGRPPAFEARTQATLVALGQAERDQQQALQQQTDARACVRELSALYHPYDLQTGRAQPVERVAQRIGDAWARVHQLAETADLPSRARERIEKAKRVTTQLLATIAFFFATLHAKVEALNLPPALETALCEQLIPAIYLDRVADRCTHAEQRRALRALSAQLLEPLRQPEQAFQALATDERQRLEQVAAECADLFQRSSSCVEGRNGQLSLHHHGHHRLSDRKLAALTAVHNFFIRRPDGTTAAERFFGRPPAPLFAQLLERLPLPPSPARRRPRLPKPAYLLPIAA